MSDRRLPVYLLIDCSESMAGPAIESVARGVDTLVNELRGNPQALEMACLSVITFSRYAKQVVPLTPLMDFQPPRFPVRPGTALGAALQCLITCINREVVKTTATTKGDYRPLVFLLTDGQPTDEWEEAANILRARKSGAQGPSIANIYAIGCGPDVDVDVLRSITDIVLVMPELTPEKIRKFFVWLSASVQQASVRVERGGPAGGESTVAPLPPGVLETASAVSGWRDPTPRQVFLHAWCSTHKKPYLMRFALRPYDRRYEPIASHPLEEYESDDAGELPPISSEMLNGPPSCAYCENSSAAVCPCGAVFCIAHDHQGPIVCPKCNATLNPGGSGTFDIRRSEG